MAPLDTTERQDQTDTNQSIEIDRLKKLIEGEDGIHAWMAKRDEERNGLPWKLLSGVIGSIVIGAGLTWTIGTNYQARGDAMEQMQHAHTSLAAHRAGFEAP